MNKKSWFIFDSSNTIVTLYLNGCCYVISSFYFLEASANHILVWPLLPLKTIHEPILKKVYRYCLQSRDSNYQIFLKSQLTFMIIFLRIHFIATPTKNIFVKSFSWIDIIFTLIYTCMWSKKGWKRLFHYMKTLILH